MRTGSEPWTVEPNRLFEQYHSLGIAHWSDFDLLEKAAEIVSIPRVDDPSSFELHAPLELLARFSLLPLV
ncbi:MAG: hypothetical protein ACREAC_18750, partial [Blastocatellia bacterium]